MSEGTKHDGGEKRFVFAKVPERCVLGIASYEEAAAKRAELQAADPEERDVRVRSRFRTRTGLWDVVVKQRREVKD